MQERRGCVRMAGVLRYHHNSAVSMVGGRIRRSIFRVGVACVCIGIHDEGKQPCREHGAIAALDVVMMACTCAYA